MSENKYEILSNNNKMYNKHDVISENDKKRVKYNKTKSTEGKSTEGKSTEGKSKTEYKKSENYKIERTMELAQKCYDEFQKYSRTSICEAKFNTLVLGIMSKVNKTLKRDDNKTIELLTKFSFDLMTHVVKTKEDSSMSNMLNWHDKDPKYSSIKDVNNRTFISELTLYQMIVLVWKRCDNFIWKLVRKNFDIRKISSKDANYNYKPLDDKQQIVFNAVCSIYKLVDKFKEMDIVQTNDTLCTTRIKPLIHLYKLFIHV